MTFTSVPVDLGERSYSITIGKNLLAQAGDHLPADIKGRRSFILADENVVMYAAPLIAALGDAELLTIPGGEQAKSWSGLHEVSEWLLSKKVDRKSVLYAVGGGVIGDLGGFSAACTLRGISFVQIPTTLLAQVDSSVGGKTGINSQHGKNLVGAFYQPRTVLCDLDTLHTLPEREMKAGYAEILKYALINDPAFFEWLEDNGEKVLARDEGALTYAIETSCRAKATIVAEDETEKGARALLNLGHTFAHALELAGHYDGRLLHGEAVSIGLVLAHKLSARMKLCGDNAANAVESHLKKLGLPTSVPPLGASSEQLIHYMQGDKKADGGKIGFILTRGIGQAFQSYDVDMNDIKTLLEI